ncbi:MAG: hypothetical protein JJU02_10735 [Cryomorphaceae bacterium]|nr:hypothetical protein [Cryomorphaceae bacterium]
MTKINNSSELKAKIIELELRGKEQGLILKEELSNIIQNVHPVELLKHGLKELVTSSEVQNELLGLSMSMGSGYIAKKIIIGNSSNILQRLMGNVISVVVSKNIAINSEKIQTGIVTIINRFRAKKASNQETDK